ncbi:uncharacterized protein [Chironomus tepperi]|uniref:uncharacterized protein n=1 Tax=Chironomus tepperi TaxID=113505 RepID=UPI00391F2470
MEIYNPKSYKRFPWKQESIDLLLDLYARKIDIFLDPSRTQLPAWKWIVSELKKTIKDQSQDLLTVMRVSNKFTGLKKKFKLLFFDPNKTDIQKQKIFPFYTKMCDLFTDYATKQLHNSTHYHNKSVTRNSHESINESIINEADVTSYVVQLLNDEDMDKTSLTIIPYEDRENFSGHVSSVHYSNSQSSQLTKSAIESKSHNSQSENEKVRIKLAEIPSEAIYIHKERMRIDPNTPFNRHINSSTILNQRSILLHNSQAPMMKRKLLDDLEPLKKKKPGIVHSSQRYSDIYANDEYEIEALDECELSDITMRRSKAIYHDTSAEISHNSPNESIITKNNHPEDKNELPLSPEQEVFESTFEIPQLPDFSSFDSRRFSDNTIRGVPREIVPKKLMTMDSNNISGSSQISLMKVNNDQPPIWFQRFLKKYEADVKSINDKLDKLISKNTSSSPVLIHPKVLSIKRDSI